jgi:2-polyprenyl-3-methyl-5-hydroxy-6-metoxy-1,4-benzoquinol methylase
MHYYRGFFSGERSFERYVDYFYDVFKVTKAEQARVLDIGCGFGLMSIILGGCGAEKVFGVDVDAVKIAGFKSLLKYVDIEDDSIRAEMGDALISGYPDESFDVIIANDVLSHVRDLELFFEEVTRLLRPTGRLYIYDDNNNLFLPNLFRYRKFWRTCEIGPIENITLRGTDEQLSFADMRSKIILESEPNLTPSQLKYIVKKTAGMYGKEIESAVNEYKEAGKIRSRKGFKYRNPRTGVFPERPLNPFRISKILRDKGFSCSALPTFFFGKLTGFKGNMKRSLQKIFWLIPSLSFIMAPSFRILCSKRKA